VATLDLGSNRIGLFVIRKELSLTSTFGCQVAHATCDDRIVNGIGKLKQSPGFSPEKVRVEHVRLRYS
jgi:hypothetical protein